MNNTYTLRVLYHVFFHVHFSSQLIGDVAFHIVQGQMLRHACLFTLLLAATNLQISHLLSSYIHIKHHNQTFCFLCKPDHDTILSIKSQIAAALCQHSSSDNDDTPDASSLRLLLSNDQSTVLQDKDTLQEYELQDDALLYLVLPVSDSEWESVDVISTAAQE